MNVGDGFFKGKQICEVIRGALQRSSARLFIAREMILLLILGCLDIVSWRRPSLHRTFVYSKSKACASETLKF